jgi:hypothetical protein
LTGFLVIALGLSWLLFVISVLAFHGIIPGANLPVEVFALGSTVLILLPTALWVTSITDGRAGLRVLLARVFRWRFGIGWWFGGAVWRPASTSSWPLFDNSAVRGCACSAAASR